MNGMRETSDNSGLSRIVLNDFTSPCLAVPLVTIRLRRIIGAALCMYICLPVAMIASPNPLELTARIASLNLVRNAAVAFPLVKPLDRGLVETWIPKVGISIVVEEHVRFGGLGSAVLELCNDLRPNLCNRIRRLGIPDKFCDKYGSQNDLFRYWGLTPENLVNQMLLNLER